nr:NADH dehydrogenase subunit 4 [Empoascanara gracilis]
MMGLFFMLLFMFILLFNWNNKIWVIFQFCLILNLMVLISFNVGSYFSLISYSLGIDYFSYGLFILSILIVSLMLISSMSSISIFNYLFLFVCYLLCLILMMIFSSLNLFSMYLFFEFSLVPLIILIYGWGYQPERLISGLYLLFYTLFASLPLFLLLIYLYLFNFSLYLDFEFVISFGFMFHFFFVFAFLVKLPMFMVHFWLPSAHVQAPLAGSMILAGLLLKIGGYGIFRVMFISDLNFLSYGYFWYSISILGGIFISLICFSQGDTKCLVAYSSVAHMSLCIMGLMSMSKWGVIGSYFLMISHGLCSSGLFCLVNVSYERLLSRSFMINKGLMSFMPSMCILWFIFCVFNMGCPPSLNFISEIMILTSMISYWSYSYYYFLFISFFSACFSFYLFSYVQHGSLFFLYSCTEGCIREFLLLHIHMLPMFFVLLSLNSFFI